jgi:hypothetical protein
MKTAPACTTRKRGRSVTLLGMGRLVPDVVGYGRGRHGKARFAGGGCSYDTSYECWRPGCRVAHLRQTSPLDGRAEAADCGRKHAAGDVCGDGGSQARHQQRAVLCLATTAAAARRARRQSRHRVEFCRHRCRDEHAVPAARYSCTAGTGHFDNGARSAGRPGRHDAAGWCAGTVGRGLRR